MDPTEINRLMASLTPAQRGAMLTAAGHGFDHQVGLIFEHVAADRVTAVVTVTQQHTQPYGLVHGGVYCTLAEACCSVGAAVVVMAEGAHAVGVENRTRFLAAARPGSVLTVVATPEQVAGHVHTWRARITDQDGRLCAEGQVQVRALPAGTLVAGQEVALKAALPGVED